MKRFLIPVIVLAVFAGALPVAADVVSPPAIHLPAGGRIVTEVNLSDKDVLGIAKASIPALGGVLKELAPAIIQKAELPQDVDLVDLINLEEFSQAISEVKDVRLLVARYPKTMTPERFASEFAMGVAKTGTFNKTLSDTGFFPGSIGVFSAPDNSGIIMFAYHPDERTAYAARVVGGVDVPKLIRWGGRIAKWFVGQMIEVEHTPSQGESEEPGAEAQDSQGAAEGA